MRLSWRFRAMSWLTPAPQHRLPYGKLHWCVLCGLSPRVSSRLSCLRADQTPSDQVPYNDESDDEDLEGAYDLREVSSDVEVDPNEMDVLDDDDEYVVRVAALSVHALMFYVPQAL